MWSISIISHFLCGLLWVTRETAGEIIFHVKLSCLRYFQQWEMTGLLKPRRLQNCSATGFSVTFLAIFISLWRNHILSLQPCLMWVQCSVTVYWIQRDETRYILCWQSDIKKCFGSFTFKKHVIDMFYCSRAQKYTHTRNSNYKECKKDLFLHSLATTPIPCTPWYKNATELQIDYVSCKQRQTKIIIQLLQIIDYWQWIGVQLV